MVKQYHGKQLQSAAGCPEAFLIGTAQAYICIHQILHRCTNAHKGIEFDMQISCTQQKAYGIPKMVDQGQL